MNKIASSQGVILICTKDRPHEISIACQVAIEASPELPIIVIDASGNDETLTACDRLVHAHAPDVKLYYRRAERVGLARQRNQGIAMCQDLGYHFIHFIDDDTRVMTRYFEAIEERFRRDRSVMGIGGIIVNQPVVRYILVKRLFLLASSQRGIVMSSGRHMLGQYPGTKADARVDWLSGCSMSFRIEIFADLQFDDTLQGYSMGEDADFSFRVSRQHRLAVEPGATCVHTVTPTIRDSASVRRRESTENTYRRVLRYRAFGLSVTAYWWATFGDVMIRCAYGLVTRDRATLEEVRGTLRGIRAILSGDVARHDPPHLKRQDSFAQ